MNIIVALLLALATVGDAQMAAAGQGQTSTARHESKKPICPDDRAWTGKYRNYNFGFTIMIPTGFKGFWNSPACSSDGDRCVCMQDHGRIIPLSTEPYEPERHIEVYADNAADVGKSTVGEEVKVRLGWIRERSRPKSVQMKMRSSVSVGGLKGERVVVRYFDAQTKRWMMEDFVELLRGRDDTEYSLYLRTPEESYEHDRPFFDSVVSSFRLAQRVW